MAVKACLNGARTRAEHPAVPQTPAELAADAIAEIRADWQAMQVETPGEHGNRSANLHSSSIGAASASLAELCMPQLHSAARLGRSRPIVVLCTPAGASGARFAHPRSPLRQRSLQH